jgi:nucleoside-diphosphate-sugar epimerase
VGVMGATRSGPVDESGPCHPRNAYEQSKLEAERLAMGWSVQFRIPLVALRPTIVFGARSGGDPDSFLGLLRAIKSRRFVYFDRLAIANYVYVEDVVAACLAGSARTARGVFIVADPCSLVDFGAAAAEALDVPAPRTHVPVLVAHGASVLLKALGTVLGRPSPLTPARVRALSNRTLFHSSTIEAALDWRPAIGYRAGLVRTVQAYCKAGSL